MQRPLAVLLILIGLIGLVLGRLGETTWAPETETTATVTLEDPGSAVVIDPGVLYVGGEEGEVVIEGASDVSVITAANGDIDAYLDGVRFTRITGASDWTTLSTEEVNPEGAAEIADPTTSDLWRSVETKPSPYTIDVADFRAGEDGPNQQSYRALLIVTDGTAPGAEKVSITWPVDAENEWVPFAYAGGAAIAVIGLVLLVVSIGGRRRDEDEDWSDEDLGAAPAGPALAGATASGSDSAARADTATDEPASAGTEPADPAMTDAASTESFPATENLTTPETGAASSGSVREESVWSLAKPTADEVGTGESAEAEPAAADVDAGEPASDVAADEAATTAESSPVPEDDTVEPESTARLHGDDEDRR